MKFIIPVFYFAFAIVLAHGLVPHYHHDTEVSDSGDHSGGEAQDLANSLALLHHDGSTIQFISPSFSIQEAFQPGHFSDLPLPVAPVLCLIAESPAFWSHCETPPLLYVSPRPSSPGLRAPPVIS